jgi:phenylacetic acid degradation operon negative regulatory protein
MAHPLARIIEQLKREPSRTGSIVITVFGDAIVPRGGSVWLGTLLEFFKALDIDSGVVRTAMSRLAADGWLERNKVGRNSFYRLAKGTANLRCRGQAYLRSAAIGLDRTL